MYSKTIFSALVILSPESQMYITNEERALIYYCMEQMFSDFTDDEIELFDSIQTKLDNQLSSNQ